METLSGDVSPSPAPFSPNASRQPVRYRTSCDHCQKIKIRCSQAKPACKNCFNRAIPCVYSPVRRMGRPKKTGNQIAPAQETTYDDCDDDLGPTTDLPPASAALSTSSSSISVSRSSGATTDSTTITTPSSAGDPATRQATVDIWDSGRAGRIDPTLAQDVQASNSLNILAQTSSNPFEAPWRNPLQAFQVNDVTASNASLVDHDYIAVLTALATLEHYVSMGPSTPSVELVFRAERDFRTLKYRIVSSRDYVSYGDPPTLPPTNPRALLVLSLLAERVVSILEAKFRSTISTISARTIDPDVPGQAQDHELPWTASFVASGNQQTAVATTTRRLERSFRGFIDKPCVFPVPGGKSEIRFGAHELAMPATARAIKAILQIRLRKMLAALLDMRAELARQARMQVDVAHGLLDWGNSDALLRGTATDFVQNLIRRLEGLQGAMVLVG